MYKIFILTKREFITSVRTKSFLIGLIIAPFLMGGSIIVIKLFEDRVDVQPRTVAVIDRSGLIADSLFKIFEYRNTHDIYQEESGEQVRPAWYLEVVEPDPGHPEKQRLELSDRVRNKEIHAFIEIGTEVLHPAKDPPNSRISYYSENSMMDDIREWIGWPLNNLIRKLRARELRIDEEASDNLFYWINVDGLGLVKMDEKTGDVSEARESNLAESLLVPYILVMIMFMMSMMFTFPLLSAVMEEKTERIAEVLLGQVSPFQFMTGKLLGSILVSLLGSAVYVIGGIVIASRLGYTDYIPYGILPWFFGFMLLFVIMVGSVMIGLGATCNNSKDAQSLQFPALLPFLIPMFVLFPVLKEPLSGFATWLSLIPPFAPMLMIIRQASPVSIPAWQPAVAMAGVVLFTLLTIWLGGKIFRTFILMQGKPPKILTVLRLSLKKNS